VDLGPHPNGTILGLVVLLGRHGPTYSRTYYIVQGNRDHANNRAIAFFFFFVGGGRVCEWDVCWLLLWGAYLSWQLGLSSFYASYSASPKLV
jgi:hypothetical protein